MSWCPYKFQWFKREIKKGEDKGALPSVVLSNSLPVPPRLPQFTTHSSVVRLSGCPCFRRHLGDLVVIPHTFSFEACQSIPSSHVYFTCKEFRKIDFPHLLLSLIMFVLLAGSSQEASKCPGLLWEINCRVRHLENGWAVIWPGSIPQYSPVTWALSWIVSEPQGSSHTTWYSRLSGGQPWLHSESWLQASSRVSSRYQTLVSLGCPCPVVGTSGSSLCCSGSPERGWQLFLPGPLTVFYEIRKELTLERNVRFLPMYINHVWFPHTCLWPL